MKFTLTLKTNGNVLLYFFVFILYLHNIFFVVYLVFTMALLRFYIISIVIRFFSTLKNTYNINIIILIDYIMQQLQYFFKHNIIFL